MDHHLIDVSSADDWRQYHRIRRTVLWDARGRGGYDEAHPDDVHPSNHPLLLRLNGQPLGTARIDEVGAATGIVRLVAIAVDRQGHGHGRMLSQLLDCYARHLRLQHLVVYAAKDAVGFYTKMGWYVGAPANPDPRGGLAGSELMSKPLQ